MPAGGGGLDLIPINFPLGCGPGSYPPQFPPWVWAWTWSPSVSPLGVGVSLKGESPWQGVSLEGGCLLWGSPWLRVSLVGGLLGRGCSFWGVSFQGVSLAGGLLGRRGASFLGGSPSGGGSIPACTEADPPVDRITDTSKNITLATTSLWPVTRMHSSRMHTVCLLTLSRSAGGVCSTPTGCRPPPH